MRKYFHLVLTGMTLLILVSLILVAGSCTMSANEGFAVYLIRDDVPPAQMEALSHVNLAEKPVIAGKDIIAYYAGTHEMELTADAFQRIAELEVSVRGRSFMVCVDRSPIYWGAFWTPISSQSFDGVTIWKPLGLQGGNIIKLELGYPSSSFYQGLDPRNNAEVLNSLKKAGKLITSTPAVDLPHSMKGYELYSWLESCQWHFTLITGTNRNKTLEEVISDANVVSEDGWVQIQVEGTEAINAVLSRLPRDEFVIWLDNLRETSGNTGIEIQVPPQEIIDDIRQHAGQYGLELIIPLP
ncbi:hypothetical protein ACFLXC_02200 [Chloroflexota bacterium]